MKNPFLKYCFLMVLVIALTKDYGFLVRCVKN